MKDQDAIDRITETENLTDALEDDDANWLINWGVGHVHDLMTTLLGSKQNDDAAGEKVNALMAVMRKLNQIAADRAVKAPDALASDVEAFAALYAKAFGQAKTIQSHEVKQAAVTLAKQTPRETMQSLLNMVTPTATKTTPKISGKPIHDDKNPIDPKNNL